MAQFSEELKKLLENAVLNDDVKTSIQEAWDVKVQEVREQAAAEIRDEFSRKFEKDKNEIVEAMNAMIQESLDAKSAELEAEKQVVIAEQVRLRDIGMNASEQFENYCKNVLVREMIEFREDRKSVATTLKDMESFVINSLTKELAELHEDAKKLAEERVEFKVQSRKELDKTKENFVKESAEIFDSFINDVLTNELNQLRDDITEAQKNQFGLKIFEAFASEFGCKFFNESKEIKNLLSSVKERDQKLEEANKEIAKRDEMISEANKKVQISEARIAREKAMGGLLQTLAGEKRGLMEDLLKDVPTAKLTEAYNKFLPAVIESDGSKGSKTVALVEKTGDKRNVNAEEQKKSADAIYDIVNRARTIKTFDKVL